MLSQYKSGQTFLHDIWYIIIIFLDCLYYYFYLFNTNIVRLRCSAPYSLKRYILTIYEERILTRAASGVIHSKSRSSNNHSWLLRWDQTWSSRSHREPTWVMMNRGDGPGPRGKRLANKIGKGLNPIFTIIQVFGLYRVSTNSIHPDDPQTMVVHCAQATCPRPYGPEFLRYLSEGNLEGCVDLYARNSAT